MSRFQQDLKDIERAVARLTGDKAQAARLRKKIQTKVAQAAAQAQSKPQSDQQKVKDLIRQGNAGWVRAEGTIKAVLVQAKTGCIFLDSNGKEINPVQSPPRKNVIFNFAAYRAHGISFEGNVAWMYQDDKGNVTVGIGHLLDNAAAARTLPFIRRGANTRATGAEIDRAFNAVKNSTLTGAKAPKFKNLTRIELDAAAIEQLFRNDVHVFLTEIGPIFPEFDTYPEIAQFGIIDIPFTMGTPNFKGIFKKFQSAVKARNWKLAAKESERKFKDLTTGKTFQNKVRRNAVVRRWFEAVVRQEPFFVNTSCKINLTKKT